MMRRTPDKVYVEVIYVNQKRQMVQIWFEYKNVEGAIDTARDYSKDPEVLIVKVYYQRMILAQFAGYYEGRVYEN